MSHPLIVPYIQFLLLIHVCHLKLIGGFHEILEVVHEIGIEVVTLEVGLIVQSHLILLELLLELVWPIILHFSNYFCFFLRKFQDQSPVKLNFETLD